MLNKREVKNPEDHPLFSEDFEVLQSTLSPNSSGSVSDEKKPTPEELRKEIYGNDVKDGEGKETLGTRFAAERESWEKRIKAISKGMADFHKLPDIQVEVYSGKQELVEYYHYLQTVLAKKLKEYRKLFKHWYRYYSTEYDLKFSKEDYKKVFIDSEMESVIEIRSELENHLKFIERTMSTMETIAFGIKHRIDIEELKRRL